MSIVRGCNSGNLYFREVEHGQIRITVLKLGSNTTGWAVGESVNYNLNTEPINDEEVPDEVWARVAQLRLTGEIQ